MLISSIHPNYLDPGFGNEYFVWLKQKNLYKFSVLHKHFTANIKTKFNQCLPFLVSIITTE